MTIEIADPSARKRYCIMHRKSIYLKFKHINTIFILERDVLKDPCFSLQERTSRASGKLLKIKSKELRLQMIRMQSELFLVKYFG